mmetsp:Transcript_44321/g.106772  ORF Transcript_44321/g.106772 Transcript_44321/m.106772 type:complete len:325 (+) Transcript_44321:49-1023(+)
MPKPVEEPTAIAIAAESDEESQDYEPSSKKPCIVCIIFLLIAGIAGAAVWYFLLRDKGDSGTSAPLPTGRPTAAPSFRLPTTAPSDNPTIVPQLFAQPSQEDCALIRNRQRVSNQDSMLATPFGLDFDVSIVEGTDTALWIATFMAALIRNLVPDMTGCSRPRRLLEESSSNSTSWQDDSSSSSSEYYHRNLIESSWQQDESYHHRNLNEIRYAIGNVNVTGEFQFGRACEDTAPVPCFRFVIKMDLYLKDALSNFRLIELVVGLIDPPDSTDTLVERMGLPKSLFERVAVVLLGTTTESPTKAPTTKAPVAAPTEAPVVAPQT